MITIGDVDLEVEVLGQGEPVVIIQTAPMAALNLAPAHVVGVSYSAAIALTLASSAPESVRTLTVMEPPPVGVPSGSQFQAANAGLLETFRTNGPLAALNEFMTMLAGPDWQSEVERDLPGGVAAMQRDASTFFESDVPALISWNFGAMDGATIRCPVFYVGGTDSGPWFAEVCSRIVQLLPHAENTLVKGAGHLLASTHSSAVARLLVDFLRRHPQA